MTNKEHHAKASLILQSILADDRKEACSINDSLPDANESPEQELITVAIFLALEEHTLNARAVLDAVERLMGI